MKKLLYFSLSISSTLFASDSVNFESIAPHIRPLYAVNRYRDQLEYMHALREEMAGQNIPQKTGIKNSLRNLLTWSDVLYPLKSVLTANHNAITRSAWNFAFNRNAFFADAQRFLFLFPVDDEPYEDPVANLFKSYASWFAQRKLGQARRALERSIPKKVTKTINCLSPVIDQKDMFDLAETGANVAIEQAIKDWKIAPGFNSMKKDLGQELATRYITNKAKIGLKFLNKKFEVYDPELADSMLNDELVDLLLYAGVYMCVKKTVTTCSRTSNEFQRKVSNTIVLL